MKRIALFIMLVAVLASVAGAETKKKTIKSMAKQQQVQQQQQAANVQMTDYDWAVEYSYHEDFDQALTHINKHLKQHPNDPYGWTCLAAIQCQTDRDAELPSRLPRLASAPSPTMTPRCSTGCTTPNRRYTFISKTPCAPSTPEQRCQVRPHRRGVLHAPGKHLQEAAQL